MLLNHSNVVWKPRVFQSLTGVTREAFAQLLPAFQQAYEQALDEADAQRETPRQRRRGGGRKAVLQTIEDKLFFILVVFSAVSHPGSVGLPVWFGTTPGQLLGSSPDPYSECGPGV